MALHPIDLLTLAEVHNRDPEAALRIASESAREALAQRTSPMATNPKPKPCPKCGSTDFLDVYRYESGWLYVECDGGGCWYRGPGAGSIRQAIKSHNAEYEARARTVERDPKEVTR